MRRLAITAALLLVGPAVSARPGDEVPEQPVRSSAPDVLAVGGRLGDDVRVLPLARKDDRETPLASFAGDPAKPLVVFFWSAKCPVCRRYAAAVRALAKDVEGRARLAFVFPNATDTEADVRAWLDAQNEAIPTALDRGQAAASKLAAVVTPTAFVFDASGALRYRGPIDDDRRARGKDTTDLLRTALDAVLAGKAVDNAEPRAFGSSVRAARR